MKQISKKNDNRALIQRKPRMIPGFSCFLHFSDTFGIMGNTESKMTGREFIPGSEGWNNQF